METTQARLGYVHNEEQLDIDLSERPTGAVVEKVCDCYPMRWILWRYLRPPSVCPPDEIKAKTVTFIALNPSTADASKNDPTLRKMLGFARHWGMWRLIVVNLWAYRATKPKDLWSMLDDLDRFPRQVPGLNDTHCVDEYIKYAALNSGLVVPAWGAGIPARHHCGRPDDVRSVVLESDAGHTVSCLGRTKSGEPRHPLMLPYNTELEPFDVG